MRELTDFEVGNLAYLTRFGLDFELIQPTGNALHKGIMDATAKYRAFLLRRGVHDYDSQPQGTDSKVKLPAFIVTPEGRRVNSTASLYRPVTKDGDPRIWFYGLKDYCAADNILVTLWFDEALWVLNATQVAFEAAVSEGGVYRDLLRPLLSARESVFDELMDMLRGVAARGFIPVHRNGDTAVGHLLETELGIKANSSKAPDYKGVELKSTRGKVPRSLNLFAKVPDWDISQLKSSRAIMQTFGYERGGRLNLNCTVSARVRNSQGLQFKVDEKLGLLHEVSNHPEFSQPATWRIDTLTTRLADKHADTFWVKAKSRRVAGQEEIRFLSVIQTTKPILQQVVPLLSTGAITMDHLMSTDHSERGPIFKIAANRFSELFPEPITHDLLA